jgi:predicted ATPase/DNA-binding winged helix-turn-helix (wHTH) protein
LCAAQTDAVTIRTIVPAPSKIEIFHQVEPLRGGALKPVEPLSERGLGFGPFRLYPRGRLLLEGEKQVRLGSRAFDLLIALLQKPGEVVSREQLEASVWPNTVVEETSLRAHVGALRKALGDGRGGARYITNVAGRGYCFVAPLESQVSDRSVEPMPQPRTSHNLPVRLTPMIGRSQNVDSLTKLMLQRRFVTIAGPGGMGKTTLALAIAEELLSHFPHGVWLVELAPIADPTRLVAAVASTLGIPVSPDDPFRALRAALLERKLLVVLDNCEHVVEAAATLAENLLRCSPGVSVLATSRERLNAEGEWVHRIASLATPPDGPRVSSAQASTFSAVELFVQRATATSDGFTLTDESAHIVGDLCRRLDGNPLAIELAASLADGIGIHGLAAGMHDRFRLLVRGRRTALPRHRTLEAALDWSYELLSLPERAVLYRLAVFRGGFSLESACSVASDAHIARGEVVECMMKLADKSLVSIDASSDVVRYRLLETTRAYALRKLVQTGESSQAHTRHALRMKELLDRAERDWESMGRVEWMAAHCGDMEDVRSALEWCFSSDNADPVIGVVITAGALLPVYELGVLDEHLEWVERALDRIHLLSPPNPEVELRLNAALLFPSGRQTQPRHSASAIVSRMFELAGKLGEPKYRISALYGLWGKEFRAGHYPAALSVAQEMRVLSHESADSAALLLSDRLLAQSLHFNGDHSSSRKKAESVLQQPARRMPLGYISPIPHAVAMRIVIARILWLEGHADQAVDMAHECIAQSAGHPFALTQSLALAACPIALWRGDGTARRLVDQLKEQSAQHPSTYWQSWGRSYNAVLALRGARSPARHMLLETENPMELDCVGTLAEEAVTAGTVARVKHGMVGWCGPEILRAHGCNLLRRQGERAMLVAEALFVRSLSQARVQGALAWELRTATSLGRLWHEQGRTREARELLSDLYPRFTEGLDTADLRDARRLLVTLQD